MKVNEVLVEFYVAQYREVSRSSKKRNVKMTHYMHKLNTKAKTMVRANMSPGNEAAATLIHQDIKRLAFLAYYSNNKEAIKVLNRQIIPQLVRLDLQLFEGDEAEQIDRDYLKKVAKETPGLICNKPLKEIYYTRRQRELKSQIINLVPAKPELEFPEALDMERHFILHIGPTNSGKTYQSLERLKEAQNGVYLGPLRLLALEVYEKMMDCGVPCTMLTGQECIEEPNSRITASTVEMLDINKLYDVAVIDEAQMVADEDRGHSWTRAILGIKAKEIHICMSPVAEEVVKHLISLCKDTYEINRYERKTELVLEDKAFCFPEDVQEGDAFIVFSKKSVLNIAARLEKKGIKSSVIYGSLPPEIRRRQMNLFNSGETKVVVSTDAIGMGLNLPVRRIVFLEMDKFDGTGRRLLELSEIKQIAGRAGRFGIHEAGYYTAMGERNLNYLRKVMATEEPVISKVSLGFPQLLLDMDAELDEIISLWHEVKPSEPFEKINIDDILFLYKEAYRNRMFIADFDDKRVLYRMVTCPIDIKDREVINQWRRYCMSYTADISLEHPDKRSRYQGLVKLESYYKKLDLYYQLSVRMGKLVDEEWLEQERDDTQTAIMQMLSRDKNEYILRCKYCGKILPVGATYKLCDDCYGIRPSKGFFH